MCQARQTDMEELFSDFRAMRCGTKADLLECVKQLVPKHDTVKPRDAKMIILDGAANINMITPGIPDFSDDYITHSQSIQ